MAYENMDKAAIRRMAEQYDKETALPKLGFWGGLLVFLSGLSGTTNVAEVDEHEDSNSSLDDEFQYAAGDCHLTVPWAAFDPHYSPMAGSDWDW